MDARPPCNRPPGPELTGMLVIHAYHQSCGRRTKIIVPDTTHGAIRPAQLCAVISLCPLPQRAGHSVSGSHCRGHGRGHSRHHGRNPNTLGLFEENIRRDRRHRSCQGGQVYCDGANMNAVMGIVSMGAMSVDVLHLNLHKTFSTPHGCGGPGSGPVCVRKHLTPFLPVPRVIEENGFYALCEDCPKSIGKLHAFYGNFGVMVKAYSYIRTMGAEGLKKASQLAVLNANYIKERLKGVLHLPYDRPCMHECVFSDKIQSAFKITTLDMAKRLMDYGFHPPTIYFPLVVHGALMIEPTETESRENIDLFIDALKAIAREAEENPDLLHDAPHKPKVTRLDEVAAARKPQLAG